MLLGLLVSRRARRCGSKSHCIWGDRGARVYLLKELNGVKGQCDVIFSLSFIGGHLGWGWGKVDSGTDPTTSLKVVEIFIFKTLQ